jgi:hypothetical protein
MTTTTEVAALSDLLDRSDGATLLLTPPGVGYRATPTPSTLAQVATPYAFGEERPLLYSDLRQLLLGRLADQSLDVADKLAVNTGVKLLAAGEEIGFLYIGDASEDGLVRAQSSVGPLTFSEKLPEEIRALVK